MYARPGSPTRLAAVTGVDMSHYFAALLADPLVMVALDGMTAAGVEDVIEAVRAGG